MRGVAIDWDCGYSKEKHDENPAWGGFCFMFDSRFGFGAPVKRRSNSFLSCLLRSLRDEGALAVLSVAVWVVCCAARLVGACVVVYTHPHITDNGWGGVGVSVCAARSWGARASRACGWPMVEIA